MNLIVWDTMRVDYLGCYGNQWVKTPNLDQLAREGVLFENAYVEGLPTIPQCTVPVAFAHGVLASKAHRSRNACFR
ncbi:MAG TPA: hypothetical protein EYP53_01715 [Candidatus Latescibacteria bacterium]|nr:hypothetical protein [Candidatus Latescibacterota bacterium]